LSIKLNSKNYSDNVLSKLKVNIRDLVKWSMKFLMILK
jgi:hypothetical protein